MSGEVVDHNANASNREANVPVRKSETLKGSLADSGVGILHVERLGGTRPVITLAGITKRYKVDRRHEIAALENISLAIPQNSIVTIVGESGSGKSTLLNVIMRLIDPDKGRIEYDSVNVTDLSSRQLRPFRKHVQYIPQDPFASLNPRRSVLHSVALGLAVQKKLERAEVEAQVAELLEHVGLRREWMYRYPHEFSGGERQRVCIARALATKPKVLVADEPTAALDVSMRKEILNLLMDLRNEREVSIVVATHDFGVVNEVASIVAVMYKGLLVEIGTKDTVLKSPQHAYTKTLIGAVLSGDPTRKRVINGSGVELGTRLIRRGQSIDCLEYRDVGSEGVHFAMMD